MTSTAEIEPTTSTTPPAAPALASVPAPPHDVDQPKAERTFVRCALIGALIGAVVCAGIWVGIVALATTNNGEGAGPLFAMAAGCGVFAGLFLGGWAGSMVGSKALEHAHHDSLPHAP